MKAASRLIDEKIKELGDWRGKTLARVRAIIHAADPEIDVVRMTFPRGAAAKDPAGLFNASLDGNARRAIDIHDGDKVDAAALKALIRAAVALNLKGR